MFGQRESQAVRQLHVEETEINVLGRKGHRLAGAGGNDWGAIELIADERCQLVGYEFVVLNYENVLAHGQKRNARALGRFRRESPETLLPVGRGMPQMRRAFPIAAPGRFSAHQVLRAATVALQAGVDVRFSDPFETDTNAHGELSGRVRKHKVFGLLMGERTDG